MRHRFHSLCPYFAMFPESFAQKWIERLTKRGDVVLDPFCGRGTTPFQALLLGRLAVACDVNDVAVCLTKAKTQAPPLPTVKRRVSQLEGWFDARHWRHEAESQPPFFSVAYARRTLQQLVYLRDSLDWRNSPGDAMIAAIVLGSLHGDTAKSGAYLSNQMPRTISTKPRYSIRFWQERHLRAPERDAFELIRKRAEFRYETPPPEGRAVVIHRDMRTLPWIASRLPGPIRCVITSPPYFDVTNFEEDQWLRLWFLGGPGHPTKGRVSRDDRYAFETKYWEFIADMWRALGGLVQTSGHVVIRIGSRRWAPDHIQRALTASAQFSKRGISLLDVEVSELKNRQTDVFRPGSSGCRFEVDCHYRFRD